MKRTPAFVNSQGLLAFWADIDSDYVLRFQQWHNCEHMPERLSIPGFLAGRRYHALGDARMFFMFYETEGPEVLRSAGYLAALNRPTPWTRESLQHFRRPLRSGYRKLDEQGEPPALESPYIALYRFNLRDERSDSADVSDAMAWLQALSRAPGVSRARLFELDSGASGVATEERKIYQGASSEQRYLALFESGAPAPWETDEWRALEQGLPAQARPAAFADVERETYWLEISLYAA
jgi:hypothetical protein